MTKQRPESVTLSHILKVLIIISAIVVITQAVTAKDSLFSTCPAVDTAAKAFAEGQLDVAIQRFEMLSQDLSAPSFVRGLALFGLAEVALARQDATAAIAAWRRLATDTSLLRFHRDSALRRIKETKRIQKGLPARDPTYYRVQLPEQPVPGKVFYVAPTGSDTSDGSQRKPFLTLEKARDAVRSLKQSHSGILPRSVSENIVLSRCSCGVCFGFGL